jgi:hypothetical protein
MVRISSSLLPTNDKGESIVELSNSNLKVTDVSVAIMQTSLEALHTTTNTKLDDVIEGLAALPLHFGTHNNLYNNYDTSLGSESFIIDTSGYNSIAVYGNSTILGSLQLECSPDNLNWTKTHTYFSIVAGNFYAPIAFAPRYLKLSWIGSDTILDCTCSAN